MRSCVNSIVAVVVFCLCTLKATGEPIVHPGVCASVPDGYFVPDVRDCQGYYYCRSGTGSRNDCPGEFYFNELQQICDHRDNVACHICQQQTGVQILPHPNNCNEFITCSEGVSYVGQCAEGYAFDRRMNVCHPAARVNCEQPACPVDDNPNVVVFLPGVERCDEYFICRSGMPVQMFCAPGLHWDALHDRCDLAELVSCTRN